MRHADRRGDERAVARRSKRWLWVLVAAAALVGWEALRHGRAHARERGLHDELHRWEGEGGQVLR